MSKYVFNFPEKYNLNPIELESGSDIITCPALYRIKNNMNFIGWKIVQVSGASLVSNINQLLTKNQILIFTDRSEEINIKLQEQFQPIITFNFQWGYLDTEDESKLLSNDGYVLTDANGTYLTFQEE